MIGKNDDHALEDIEQRIESMERRLKNAKAARDTYLTYLRSKYPMWKPSFTTFKFEKEISIQNMNESLVNRLATSQYQWDVDSDQRRVQVPRQQGQVHLYSEIPMSGPLLHSDLGRTRKRLQEISAQLQVMRGSRMALSTEEYLRTSSLARPSHQPIKMLLAESSTHGMSDIRQKLSDLEVSPYEPPRTPTREQIEDEKMLAQREQLINGECLRKAEPQFSLQNQPTSVRILREPQVQIPAPIPSVVNLSNPEPLVQQNEEVAPVQPPAPQKPVEKVEVAKKEEAKSSSAYSQMMNLLGQKPGNSSESDETPRKPVEPVKSVKISEPKKETNLLSQYLSKRHDSSSDDEFVGFKPKPSMPAKKVNKPSMSAAFLNNDSDDDFFG
ncbi:unnamed protein product [Caenorhabditis auriculariae]|uniref:Uncharacterized protein n=1 Tax=Caenorhabditis auriculariae TaxID=2777116 RepID=A0A8S1H3J2_9PELO|nr:unnamed protein product [Caenorhabditis auriculariae]